MLRQLEVGLDRLDLGPPWHAERRREEARAMVRRLAAWLRAGTRELVAAELAFQETVGRAALTGRVDRLERDTDGRGVVVDLKTGSRAAQETELEAHPQLAVYQLAIEVGAFRDQGLTEPGGAELVQVGGGARGSQARVQAQPALSTYVDPTWAQHLVEQVADGMAGSTFQAVDNSYCRKCPVRSSCPLHEDGRQVGS
jgi:RecB family exonuclease